MDRIIAASSKMPTWTRWAGWLVTGAMVVGASIRPHAIWTWLAIAAACFTFFANLPALAFDGPMPFSSQGVHVRGRVVPWDDVVRIEPSTVRPRDLQLVAREGSDEYTVPLRVRGGRTHDDLRTVLDTYAPDKAEF